MSKRVALSSLVAAALAAAVAVPFAASASHTQRAAQTVSVTMKEFMFVSPQLKKPTFGKHSNLEAGPTTFTFKNTGKFAHDFTIAWASPGATKFTSGMVQPGQSKTMTVNLKPGAYLAVCTQFNGFHLASGMTKTFTVGMLTSKGKWVK
jgi:plastocyanin